MRVRGRQGLVPAHPRGELAATRANPFPATQGQNPLHGRQRFSLLAGRSGSARPAAGTSINQEQSGWNWWRQRCQGWRRSEAMPDPDGTMPARCILPADQLFAQQRKVGQHQVPRLPAQALDYTPASRSGSGSGVFPLGRRTEKQFGAAWCWLGAMLRWLLPPRCSGGSEPCLPLNIMGDAAPRSRVVFWEGSRHALGPCPSPEGPIPCISAPRHGREAPVLLE